MKKILRRLTFPIYFRWFCLFMIESRQRLMYEDAYLSRNEGISLFSRIKRKVLRVLLIKPEVVFGDEDIPIQACRNCKEELRTDWIENKC